MSSIHFCIWVEETKAGTWECSLTSNEGSLIVSRLAPMLGEQICLFNVEFTDLDPETGGARTLEQAARARALDCRILDRDVVLMQSADYADFLDEFSHYQLYSLGFSGDEDDETLLDAVILASGRSQDAKSVLQELPDFTLYVDNHDDLHVYMEVRSKEAALRIAGEALVLEIESELELALPSPPSSILARYFDEHHCMEFGFDTMRYADREVFFLPSSRPTRISNPDDPLVAAILTFELDAERWSIWGVPSLSTWRSIGIPYR